MKRIILSLHSVSSFCFCLFLSFRLQFPGRRWRMSARWGSQGRLWKEFVCVCNCEWNASDWIDKHMGRSLQGPVTIRASNPGVSMIRRRAHASSQSLWQAQYIVPRKPFGGVVGPVASAAVAVCAVVFGWDQCRRKQPSNRHKISMIDHRLLPSSSVTLSTWRKEKKNQNTLLSKLSNMENGVGE